MSRERMYPEDRKWDEKPPEERKIPVHKDKKSSEKTDNKLLETYLNSWVVIKGKKEGEECIGMLLYKKPLLLLDVSVCIDAFRNTLKDTLKEKFPQFEPEVDYISGGSFITFITSNPEIILLIGALANFAAATIGLIRELRENRNQPQHKEALPEPNSNKIVIDGEFKGKIIIFKGRVSKGKGAITDTKEGEY